MSYSVELAFEPVALHEDVTYVEVQPKKYSR